MTVPAEGPPAPAASHDSPVRSRGGLRASVLIGLCCFLVYNVNLRSITAGDTYPARYMPFAIVQYHTVFLEPVEKVAAQGRGNNAYWLLRRPDGRIISLYPVVGSVLVAPLYIPAVAYLHFRGWTDARLDRVAKVMEKLTASFLAALSASLFYLLIRRRTAMRMGSRMEPRMGPRIALLLTLAYAFGTTTWVIASQALWQHGMAELLLIGAMLALTAPPTARRALAAGLLLGLVAANRPPDIILSAALGTYGLFWAGRRRAPWLVAAAAVPLVAVLFYNLAAVGNVGGGYGVIDKVSFFRHDLLTGLSGLLLSPTKGLLVFSPFLIFLGLAWHHLPDSRDERRLTLAIGVGVILLILLYARTDWRGGLSWGPRYMTDLLPLLVWMLVPVVAALRRAGRGAFQLTVGVAVALEVIGAFSYAGSFDLPVYAADGAPETHDMRPAFVWGNASYLTGLQQGFAPMDLAVAIRGSFDAIETDGRATTIVTIGQQAFVEGWALAGGATPAQVAVSIDGRAHVATSVFFDRPDVRVALNTASPAGWRIALDTTSLAPGVHRLTAFAWASGKGESSYLYERTLTVRPAGAVAPATPVASGASGTSTHGR